MLRKERNRWDGEPRAGRVLYDEVVPASKPEEPISRERGGQAIRSLKGGRPLLEEHEVIVSVPSLDHGQLPNGSRLSCGRTARRRKEVEPQIETLASEATQFLPTCERPAASSAC